VVAAAATFGIAILLWIIGAIHSEGTLWRTALSSVSLLDHFGEFANGVVELRNVVYYLSFTVFMLFVSLRAVESQRWRG
jgi:ABC-2 type transport system permease protein